MKPTQTFRCGSFVAVILTVLAIFSLSSHIASAHPYAANITGTNSSGFVSFVMNEDGAFVTVVYEDGTTNTIPGLDGTATLSKGTNTFYLEPPHVSFKIICYKQGNGVPILISDNAFTNSVWTNGTGFAVNQNPKIGGLFGTLYAGNAVNTPTPGGPNKLVGIYAMDAAQGFVRFSGPTNIPGTANTWNAGIPRTIPPNGAFNSNFKSPSRMRVAPDNTLLVADGQGVGNQNRVYQFAPDLSTAWPLLGPSPSTGAGDLFGTPVVFGSTNTGDLVLYTASAGEGVSGDTNCIKGPLTGAGSFNCIYMYNIGSGPLPWNKRPDYAYTVGLDGIAQLRPEVDVLPDRKVIAAFGRSNGSNPNIQVLRPFQTTNGITGDLANKAVQEAAQDATNWLYTSGVTPPFNTPPPNGDPWNGINGAGALGTYGGVRASPDGKYFASLDNNNGLTVANLTNGIPDDSTIFGIVNAPAAGNEAGMDWDKADNLWAMCRIATPATTTAAQARLRCYSLGLTTTCVSSNDWTGTNGTFALVVPSVQTSVAVINGKASQNYTNNTSNPGVAKPGVFRISLNTNDTTAVGITTVGFVRSGVGSGDIVGIINVTNGGTGYTTAPTVTINRNAADTTGVGATATATISGGSVVAVTVTSPGRLYTVNPGVAFSGGGGTGAGAITLRGLDLGQYTINTNELPNGVTVTPNAVVFPAGLFSGSNGPNWNVDVKITPTQYPVSGPTYEFDVRLLGGTNYSAIAPSSASIAILNTGPQLIQLSAAAPASLNGMSRGIPNDQCRFVLTRWGDTNGPDNDAVNAVVARPLTITNLNYLAPAAGAAFKANNPLDYTAAAQKFTGVIPTDSAASSIVINPGDVTVTGMIGNPVKHTSTSITATNLSVFINLTNTVAIGSPASTTNVLSGEGSPYKVGTGGLTLNEFDNALGGEVVVWSNPLTNSFDSTNWTLVYASINQLATNPVSGGFLSGSPGLPTIISNYDNSANVDGLPYYANFGKSVLDAANDGGVSVPQSAAMLANNWTNALKVTINKSPGSAGEAGVNLYPQIPGAPWNGGSNMMVFQGNYALRFDMYLSLYDFGPFAPIPAREFAAFGINHRGTNANWRLDVNPRANGTGARPINSDGQWCSIGASSGSITPADWDMFMSPPLAAINANGAGLPQNVPYTTNVFTLAPFTNVYLESVGGAPVVTNIFANAGVAADQVSQGNNTFGGAVENGILKNPPFTGVNNFGGAPDNAWLDVSLELRRQTNLSLRVAQQIVMQGSITNPPANGPAGGVLAPFGGTPMLGYLDPNINISDYSAFVYYSNVRVVELSPFIPWTNQPIAGLIVTQGTTFTLSSGATYASNPLTNTWYRGTTNGPLVLINPPNKENGTPTAAIITNVFATNNAITNITVANIQGGTNYISVWSDAAGAVTNFLSVVEVIAGPGIKTTNAGFVTSLAVTPSGNAPPSAYRWMAFGTNLVSDARYGATTNAATLFITNVQPADAGIYSNVVVNAYGSVSAIGQLIVQVAPTSVTVAPSSTNRPWGSAVTFTASVLPGNATTPLTYQWKKGGVNLTDGGNISGASSSALTITNLNQTTYGGVGNTYVVGVTNSAGGLLSSAGLLNVVLLQHSINSVSVSGGLVSMSFTSSNSFDNLSAFTLQSSGDVNGPYTNAPGTFSVSGGGFQVTAPTDGATMFYRLIHSN